MMRTSSGSPSSAPVDEARDNWPENHVPYGKGAIMRQIIYCVLLIAIWLCSTASVICVLNFGGLGLVLIAGACFASVFSSVALAKEFVEWRHHTEASPVKRLLLPPAS